MPTETVESAARRHQRSEAIYQRDQARKAKREAEYQRKRAERYEAENKKLRELVRELLYFITYSPRPRTTDESVRMAHELFEMDVRAHELGIEVGP